MAANLVDLTYIDSYMSFTGASSNIQHRIFDYDTSDNIATSKGANYWLPLFLELRAMDLIRVNASDGNYKGIVLRSDLGASPVVFIKDIADF